MTNYDLNKMSINSIIQAVASDQELKLAIADNMLEYGGSFVKALSVCFLRADRQNTAKLAEAFIQYILDYQPKNWNEPKPIIKDEAKKPHK